MSTKSFVQKARAVETLAAEVYRRLALRFAGSNEAKVFSQLALEEEQHSVRLELLLGKRGAQVSLDESRLDALLQEGEVLLALVREEGPGVSLEEALHLMVKLEENFASVHAERVAGDVDPSLRALFDSLARQDRMHAHVLKAAVARFKPQPR